MIHNLLIEDPEEEGIHTNVRNRARFFPLTIVLLLTLLLIGGRDFFRRLDHDELVSFYTDSQSSALGVIRVQLHTPISLDPPGYHLLSHAAMLVVGRNALAVRLPSVLGFLLMQICMYLFLQRVGPANNAILGALLPIAANVFPISIYGRPYGLLCGLGAAALLCWQSKMRRRSRPLITFIILAAVMSLAVTVHFFGFLVPLAISVLAIHRALKTRRIDWDIFGALGVSLGAVALILPFKRAVAVFQSHYWAVNNVSLSDIPRSYSGLFVESGPDWMMQLLGAIILILIILGGTRLVLKSDRHTSPTTDEAAAILAFALLPIVGTVVGTFVTHTFQPKYAAEGSVGIFLLAGVFYKSRCRAPGKDRVILAVGALGILLALYQGAKTYRAGNKMDANFVARGPVVRELASSANFPIYMQNAEEFLRDSYYGPDYSIRKRLRLLYGREEELALHHTDSGALTAQYLQNLSTLKSEPFSEFCNGQPHLLLTSGTAWEWIGDGLRLRNATVRDIGSYMGGKLQSVVCR